MRILALPAAALLALCLYLPLPRLYDTLHSAPDRLRALLARRHRHEPGACRRADRRGGGNHRP